MAGVRSTILDNLVTGLATVDGVKKATEYLLSLDNTEKLAPIVSLSVESEEPVSPGSDRYTATLKLEVVTDETRTGIEELIEDIKEYIGTASIPNVIELLYAGHADVPKQVTDESRFASVNIFLSLLYADDNDDTEANAHPSGDLEGYMAISHYKVYARLVSGSYDINALGTNVYDSHMNDNIVSSTSGSLSVGLILSDIDDDSVGIHATDQVDLNNVFMTVRGHFPTGTAAKDMASMMYRVGFELKDETQYGDSYILKIEPFTFVYNNAFEESSTIGAELAIAMQRYWDY